MRKRILALALALIMTIGVFCVPALAEGLQGGGWAMNDLNEADELGLVPDVFRELDLTKDITRVQFAAIVVTLYENLTGVEIAELKLMPFSDTEDEYAIKAFSAGLMRGDDNGNFNPDALLTRQEAAVALTRVVKSIYIEGWTFEADRNGDYILNFEQPDDFIDDADIASWAVESVYFMATYEVLQGFEGNFNPLKNAEIQEAIIIAKRIVTNFEEVEELDYSMKADTGDIAVPTPR